jgi:hypothetical protein
MSIVDYPAVATISGFVVVAVADPAVVPVVDPAAVALADFAAVTTTALLLLQWLTLLLLQWLTLAACVVMWGPCLTELLLSKWELGKLYSGSIRQIFTTMGNCQCFSDCAPVFLISLPVFNQLVQLVTLSPLVLQNGYNSVHDIFHQNFDKNNSVKSETGLFNYVSLKRSIYVQHRRIKNNLQWQLYYKIIHSSGID